MSLFNDLADICRRDVPLAPMTWFKLGGRAEYLAEPRNEAELATLIRRCRETNTPLRILGLGANVLIADEGVSGVVLRLTANAFNSTRFEGSTVDAGAGVDMTKLVISAVRRGLAGLEHLAGIPGTVGGGVCMNCGGRHGEIASAVRSVRLIDPMGRIETRSASEMEFGYRHCRLDDAMVVGATFELHETDPEELNLRFREIWDYKQSTQPPLGAHSAGCIFRNPQGCSAGALIDRAGLKGFRIGSAFVSSRHANFILADEGGRATDVFRLIGAIQQRVNEQFGVMLEPEVRTWQSEPVDVALAVRQEV